MEFLMHFLRLTYHGISEDSEKVEYKNPGTKKTASFPPSLSQLGPALFFGRLPLPSSPPTSFVGLPTDVATPLDFPHASLFSRHSCSVERAGAEAEDATADDTAAP